MVNLVTGMTGVEHVTSDDERIRNYACFGKDINYVIDVGEKFRAEKISNNTVRVHSGTLITQGTQMEIELNDFVDCHIDNGTIGVNRIDAVVFRYEKDANTSLEKGTVEVVKGVAGENPNPPQLSTGNILDGGDLVHEVALHYIYIEGTEIVATKSGNTFPLKKSLTMQLMDRPEPSEEGANRYLSKLNYGSATINEADKIVITSYADSDDVSHFYVKTVFQLFNKIYDLIKSMKISDLWSALKSKATPDMEKIILKNSKKEFPPNEGESLVNYIFRYEQNVMAGVGTEKGIATAITNYGDSTVLIMQDETEINAVAYDLHNNMKQVYIRWGGGKYGNQIVDYNVKEYATTETVTTSSNGLMAKEDKSKLNGLFARDTTVQTIPVNYDGSGQTTKTVTFLPSFTKRGLYKLDIGGYIIIFSMYEFGSQYFKIFNKMDMQPMGTPLTITFTENGDGKLKLTINGVVAIQNAKLEMVQAYE